MNFTADEIISYGIADFVDLSSKHFEALAIDLGFSHAYHKDLRRICKEFAEAALPSIGFSTPSKQVEVPSYDKTELLAAWQKAFSQLEAIGYDEIICDWLVKLKFEDKLDFQVQMNAWNNFLIDWAMNPSSFPVLHLSRNLIQEIRILVMLQHTTNVDMHFKFPRVKHDLEMDEWEEYVMTKDAGDARMRNRIRFQQNLTKWVGIFRLMTKRQIKIMDKWGNEQFKYKHDAAYAYFPLNELAMILQEKGYF